MNEKEEQEFLEKLQMKRWIDKCWEPYKKLIVPKGQISLKNEDQAIEWMEQQRLKRQEFLEWKEKNKSN